jgi:hypothetical protein
VSADQPADPLYPVRNLLYATGMIRRLARMAGPGVVGSQERIRFVDTCCMVFDVTPAQVDDALHEPACPA